MNWHYVSAGQSVGPISDADLEQLAQSGTIQPDTLVWNESMTAWQPYGSVKPGGSVSAPSNATPTASDAVTCAECGKSFSRNEAINVGGAWVCAACKPVFVQRMKEGAAPALGAAGYGNLPADPEEMLKLIRERGYNLDVGSCFNRSWELLKSNFWLVVGATFLSSVIQQGPQLIPILGVFVALALYGIMAGGLYQFFIKLIRGQSGGFGDIFSGFGPRWLQLMFVPIIQGLLILILVAAFAAVVGIWFYLSKSGKTLNPVVFLIIPVVMVPVVYLGLSWLFSLPLVIDRGMNAWPAMELSRKVITMHWWSFFVLMLAGMAIILVGFLACGIGILVAIPVFTGMLTYAYDDIFGSGRALGT